MNIIVTQLSTPAVTRLPTYLLTYSVEQIPSWEANWFCSQTRNSPHFWNPKVPHRTHKCPPPVPILSQLHPVPTTPSHFLRIHILSILLTALSKKRNRSLVQMLDGSYSWRSYHVSGNYWPVGFVVDKLSLGQDIFQKKLIINDNFSNCSTSQHNNNNK